MKELLDELRVLRTSITEVTEFVEGYDDLSVDEKPQVLDVLDTMYNDLGELLRELSAAHAE